MSAISAIVIIKEQFPKSLRLNTAELAVLLDCHRQTILNQVSDEKFPIHTYVDGRFRYADIRDVAAYFDSQRKKRAVGRPTKASKIESASAK